MKTLISEILLKELPEKYTEGIHKALVEYVKRDEDTTYSTAGLDYSIERIRNFNSIHSIARYIEQLMKANKATIWNMLDVFTEFRVMLDKCNDLVPKGIISTSKEL